jgi:hypothetical protein
MRRTAFFWLLLLLPFSLRAQDIPHARVQLGLQSGLFRISVDRFDEYYGNRIAFPVGGHVSYALSSSFHIILKMRYFQKKHRASVDGGSIPLERIWREQWWELGIQQYSFSFAGTARTFLGFGLAFFHIREENDGRFLQEIGIRKREVFPKGFYICGGYDHHLTDRITAFFELELSSAGLGEGTGIEAQSIGGIFISAGLNILLF